MNTKRKAVTALIILASAVLICAFVWRVVAVNLKYPAPTLKSYEIGETVRYLDNYEITVVKSEFLSDDRADELFDVENMFPDMEQKFLVVTLKIKNISNEVQEFAVENLIFQSGAFFNAPMIQGFEALNGWCTLPELSAGEEQLVKLPLNISKSRFRDSQWNTITERPFELVLGLYPEREVLKLQ